MVSILLQNVAYRLVFPVALLIACIIRPSFLSLLYSLLGLCSFLFPNIRHRVGVEAPTRVYLSVTFAVIFLCTLAQTAYQIYAASALSDDVYKRDCLNSTTQRVLRQFGLVKITSGLPSDYLRILLPDYAAFVVALAALISCVVSKSEVPRESANAVPQTNSDANAQQSSETSFVDARETQQSPSTEVTDGGRIGSMSYTLKRLSDVLMIILTFVVGTIQPSALSSVYFIIALVLTTWWSMLQPLCRRYVNRIKLFLMGYVLLHLSIIYLYQMPLINKHVESTASEEGSKWSKLLGVTRLVAVWQCPNPEWLTFATNIHWNQALNPIALLVYFVFVTVQYSVTRHGVSRRTAVDAANDDTSSVHEEFDTPTEEMRCNDATPVVRMRRRMPLDERSPTTSRERNGVPRVVIEMQEHGDTDEALLDEGNNATSSPSGGSAHENHTPSRHLGVQETARLQRLLSRSGATQVEKTMTHTVLSGFSFIIYHGYTVALVTMMLWAIMFRSWLALVWLITASVLWVMRDTRKWTFTVSPLLVAYAEVLLMVDYIFAVDSLIPKDLGAETNLDQFGLSTSDDSRARAPLHLWLKFLFALPFFVTLRLYLRERNGRPATIDVAQVARSRHYGTFVSVDGAPPPSSGVDMSRSTDFDPSAPPRITGTWVGDLLSKYWIFVVSATLLFIAIFSQVNMFSIAYWFLFGSLVTLLLVSFHLFRVVLFAYWTIVVAYSAAVICLIYLYQFAGVEAFVIDNLQINKTTMEDIGLVPYTEPSELLSNLIGPIAFFAVAILQLKFFHTAWLKCTDLKTARDMAAHLRHVESARHLDDVEAQVKEDEQHWEAVKRYGRRILNLVYLLLELHMTKVVTLAFVCLAASEASALNFVLVCIVTIMLFIPRLERLLTVAASGYVTLVAGAKMFYQLQITTSIDVLDWRKSPNCTFSKWNDTELQSTFGWAGLRKLSTKTEEALSSYLSGYVTVMCLLAFSAIVRARQTFKRVATGKQQNVPETVLFPEVTRKEADNGICEALQFIANYVFYKFGVELCYVMILIVALVRMDAVAGIYVLLLFVFIIIPSRTVIARVWFIPLLVVTIALPLQYAFAVGFPPFLCIDYPWLISTNCVDTDDSSICWPNAVMYCFLPDYEKWRPNSWFLVADFILLLMLTRQRHVFGLESDASYGGGSNSSIFEKGVPKMRENEVADFISHKRSFLDFVKDGFFMYGHWVTIIMVFVAGLGGQSLFALGYLIAAFAFLWKGNDLYLNPMSTVKKQWRALAVYCVVVVFFKVALQFPGCAFESLLTYKGASSPWSLCIPAQLFSIACVNPRKEPELTASTSISADRCELQPSEARIVYDLVCFIFLMVQLRVLQSWYFQHVVLEYRAQRILSSRGAVLINQLIRKQMREQSSAENRTLETIRKRVEAIRSRYAKQMQDSIVEPSNYADAKRAGDYYMFDYDPDEDDKDADFFEKLEEEQTEKKEPIAPGEEGAESDVDKFEPGTSQRMLGPAQLIHTAAEHNLDFGRAAERQLSTRNLPKEKRAEAAVHRERTRPHNNFDSLDNEETVEKKKSFGEKITGMLQFALRLYESTLDKIASWANFLSRDYRYVAHVLDLEKRKLKERMGSELYDCSSSIGFRDMRRDFVEGTVGHQICYVKNEEDVTKMEEEAYTQWREKNALGRFFTALGYALISRTEELCYMFMVLDHANTASIMSLPLPLLAFLWGTLCTPRPPKAFWIVVIAYTQAIVVIKFVFQFKFWPWNATPGGVSSPHAPTALLGVHATESFANWDVVLLIALFFHRYVLRSMGLWKDAQRASALEEHYNSEDSARSHRRQPSALSNHQASGASAAMGSQTPLDRQGPQRSAHFTAYFGGVVKFFNNVLHPCVRYIKDLYPYMFLCDTICLLVATFGYSSFGVDAGTGNILSDVTSNRIPLTFVLMILVLTVLMIIDRALYLRKTVIGKLVFQYLLVFGVHAWIFFALPLTTNHRNLTAKTWYVVKCIYFLFSAWQIRNGYPRSSIGHLLMKSYNLVAMVLFKVFMVAPFIFELRTLIDWTWTDTSFPLFDYFNMENNFATIYWLRCMRKFESDFPQPRGEKKPSYIKYLMGIPIIVLIVLLVFGPLLAYSLVNHIGKQNLPVVADLSIEIDGFPKLYEMQARDQLTSLSPNAYGSFFKIFSENRAVYSFAEEYSADDVQKVPFLRSSTSDWAISTPARYNLVKLLDGTDKDKDVTLRITLSMERPPDASSTEPPSTHTIVWTKKLSSSIRERLAAIINRTLQDDSEPDEDESYGQVEIERAISPYLLVPNRGRITSPVALANAKHKDTDECMKYISGADRGNGNIQLPIYLNLARDSGTNGTFWKVYLNNSQGQLSNCIFSTGVLPETAGQNKTVGLLWVAFVDKTFPAIFSMVVSTGIIAMYIAVVLVVGRLVRGLVTNDPTSVIIVEMPYVDRLLKMCRDIYVVREARDFYLEQDLFARLIFLFRSPDTLIKWTRPKVKRD